RDHILLARCRTVRDRIDTALGPASRSGFHPACLHCDHPYVLYGRPCDPGAGSACLRSEVNEDDCASASGSNRRQTWCSLHPRCVPEDWCARYILDRSRCCECVSAVATQSAGNQCRFSVYRTKLRVLAWYRPERG